MKKIQREVKTYKDVFVSDDGKEFYSEEDCKKWENSYRATLETSIKKLNIIRTNAEDAYLAGFCCDDETWILKLNSIEELALLNAWIDACTSSDEVLTADIINKEIALCFGYDRDYCYVYVLSDYIEKVRNALNEFIDKLNAKEEQ